MKRDRKLKALNEMPTEGNKRRKMENIMEITHQEGEFDDDEEMEEEIRKFLKIQMEERERMGWIERCIHLCIPSRTKREATS